MKASTLAITVLALGIGFCVAPGCQGPDAPDLSNPLDPTDPDYVQPLATITAGPGDGETVTDADVSFTWSGAYRVNAFRHRLDGSEWTDWLAETSVEFPLLDEGDHVFEVVSRYPTGDEQAAPTKRTFTVDAVKGPALMFRPRRVVVASGDMFSVDLVAEEVEDLMGAHVVVEYDAASLDLREIVRGNFLSQNGGIVVFLEDASPGAITIETAVAEGAPRGASGTGALATLTFRARSAMTTQPEFADDASLRDSTNTATPLVTTVPGSVVAE